MSRSPRRSVLPVLLTGLALGLAACGGDGDEDDGGPATEAVAGTTYPASKVCELLPIETVEQMLPGATLDISLPSEFSCVYGSDGGDIVFNVNKGRTGPGDGPTIDEVYEVSRYDAAENGAESVVPAKQLGERGQIATNTADSEVTGFWVDGGAVYDLQFSGWDGSAKAATAKLEQLAEAITPLP